MPTRFFKLISHLRDAPPEMVETTARVLYETDEDIVDESIADLLSKGEEKWLERRYPRMEWSQLDASVQEAYRRRGRAAISVLATSKIRA